MNMGHLDYIAGIQEEDAAEVRRKEATYQGSWKKRGGAGAWMMMARKWDRLEVMMAHDPDIFAVIESDGLGGEDGTALAEVRDLRRYLLLVEAEVAAREPGSELRRVQMGGCDEQASPLVLVNRLAAYLEPYAKADPVSRRAWVLVDEMRRAIEATQLPATVRGM